MTMSSADAATARPKRAAATGPSCVSRDARFHVVPCWRNMYTTPCPLAAVAETATKPSEIETAAPKRVSPACGASVASGDQM